MDIGYIIYEEDCDFKFGCEASYFIIFFTRNKWLLNKCIPYANDVSKVVKISKIDIGSSEIIFTETLRNDYRVEHILTDKEKKLEFELKLCGISDERFSEFIVGHSPMYFLDSILDVDSEEFNDCDKMSYYWIDYLKGDDSNVEEL